MAYATIKICEVCDHRFIASSNVQRFCKPCKRERRKQNQAIYNHTYYMKNQESKLEGYTAYNKSEKGRASQKLRDAIRQGKIQRQPCEICQKPNADGHHEDYSKPLEVRWLCKTHHAQEHLYEPWQNELIQAGYKGEFDLKSLIEACGHVKLEVFPEQKSAWAQCCDRTNFGHKQHGATPEEALKNLWIALNKK